MALTLNEGEQSDSPPGLLGGWVARLILMLWRRGTFLPLSEMQPAFHSRTARSLVTVLADVKNIIRLFNC